MWLTIFTFLYCTKNYADDGKLNYSAVSKQLGKLQSDLRSVVPGNVQSARIFCLDTD
jgi:hypothetical protein